MKPGIRADGLADRRATHRGDDRGRVGASGGVDIRGQSLYVET